MNDFAYTESYPSTNHTKIMDEFRNRVVTLSQTLISIQRDVTVIPDDSEIFIKKKRNWREDFLKKFIEEKLQNIHNTESLGFGNNLSMDLVSASIVQLALMRAENNAFFSFNHKRLKTAFKAMVGEIDNKMFEKGWQEARVIINRAQKIHKEAGKPLHKMIRI